MGVVHAPADRLVSSLEGMREGLQIIGQDWRYLYLNDAACRHAQHRRDELLGRTMMEVFPGIEETELFAKLERVRRHHVCEVLENEFTYPDGTQRWFDLRVSPSPEGIVVLSVDITDRKRLERQMMESQRLEAVGRLAGGVAHDFNNLLTAIDAFASFARRRLESGEDCGEELDGILDASRRAAELTRQLLSFARKRPVAPAPLDVNDVLRDLQRLLDRALGEDIDVRTHLGPEPWPVFMDGGALAQVFLNLGVNARDAMTDGGRLTIETANVTLSEPYSLGKSGQIPPGDYVMVTFSDEGCGMPPEVQARAFEPFFTTKTGFGSGLGLATCFGIVRQAGGYIGLYSEPGEGTTFKIYLPRRQRPTSEPQRLAPLPSRRVLHGHETVLVVEDDARARAQARRALTPYGYTVLEAASPHQAISITRRAEHIDLLVTEMALPEMNGPQLAARALEQHPDLRVLYLDPAASHASLAEAVRELLDRDAVL